MEINCLKIQEKLIEKLKDEISQIKLLYKIEPKIVFIKCNEDQNSEIFLKKKIAFATQLGIKSKIITEINNEKLLIEKINELNNNSLVHGILIQLPLFKNINNQTVFNSISYTKDVDVDRTECTKCLLLHIRKVLTNYLECSSWGYFLV